jgi:hypothetical protein
MEKDLCLALCQLKSESDATTVLPLPTPSPVLMYCNMFTKYRLQISSIRLQKFFLDVIVNQSALISRASVNQSFRSVF